MHTVHSGRNWTAVSRTEWFLNKLSHISQQLKNTASIIMISTLKCLIPPWDTLAWDAFVKLGVFPPPEYMSFILSLFGSSVLLRPGKSITWLKLRSLALLKKQFIDKQQNHKKRVDYSLLELVNKVRGSFCVSLQVDFNNHFHLQVAVFWVLCDAH